MESRTESAPAADGGRGTEGGRGWDAVVVGAVVAAFLIRFSAAKLKILWFDEFLAGNLARRSWPALLPAVRQEAHPPLYYALLKLWCSFLGDGWFGLKSLSVVAGTAAVAVTAAAVRRSMGGAAVAAAAVLVALSTVQIDQGSEAKPYGVLAFLVVLVVWTVIHDRSAGTGGALAAMLAAGAACASTHFYGSAAAGAIACAAIVTAPDRRSRSRAVLLLASVSAVSAIWLAGAFRLDPRAADYIRKIWERVPIWAPLAASTRVAFPGWRKPYPPMNGRILPRVEVCEIVAAAVVAGIVAGALIARRRGGAGRAAHDELRAADRRFLAFAALAIWPGFIALEIALAAVDRPIALVGRSEVVPELGFAILLAVAVSRWRRPAIPIAALAAVGLWTVVPQWRPRPVPRGRRWEDVIVERLRSALPPGRRADIVTLGLARPPFDYYANGDPRLRFLSFPESQNSHPGWAPHSVSAAERAVFESEAARLTAFLDAELDRGVPVYVAARPDPRNEALLSELRRNHDVKPVPWGAAWFLQVTKAPVLSARERLREPFSPAGVRYGEGGSTCLESFAWRFSSFSRPRRLTPPTTAGSRSRWSSEAARAASIRRGAPSTSRRSGARPTRSA